MRPEADAPRRGVAPDRGVAPERAAERAIAGLVIRAGQAGPDCVKLLGQHLSPSLAPRATITRVRAVCNPVHALAAGRARTHLARVALKALTAASHRLPKQNKSGTVSLCSPTF